MAIAHQRPLNNPQMKLAINELERTATFCLLLDYSPVKISELIENNPAVAVVLIRQLIASSHEDICLSAVISSPVTLHSMEVFNGLLSTLELPNEFITAYISNCIQSCDRIRDRLSQSRQVRLVCVFLQSVFRNPALSMHQFQIEIESFCIQYSWVKEATIVFQSLKRG
ncbi:hypothetical protein BC829DRAFT_106818 [Chytridium lagenaria]|nr:hypothetical protein BC829DRAFT_106818 [Chytridium lagenaria]